MSFGTRASINHLLSYLHVHHSLELLHLLLLLLLLTHHNFHKIFFLFQLHPFHLQFFLSKFLKTFICSLRYATVALPFHLLFNFLPSLSLSSDSFLFFVCPRLSIALFLISAAFSLSCFFWSSSALFSDSAAILSFNQIFQNVF